MPTLTQEEFKNKYGANSLAGFGISQPKQGYLSKLASNIKNTFVSGAENISEAVQRVKPTAESIAPLDQKAGVLEYGLSSLKTAGDIAGSVASTTGGIIGSAIEPLLSDNAKQTIGNVFKYIDDAISQIPGMTPDIKRSLGNIFETVTLKGGSKVEKMVENTTKQGINIAKQGINIGLEKLPKSFKYVAEKSPQYADKVVKWFVSEPSEQVKTILKETPTSKFDEYLKVAQEAVIDPRKSSVFEKVGDRLADATKQIKQQADSIGSEKSKILQKASVGLEKFTDDTRKAILKVVKLEDSPLRGKIIDELKNVKTKLGADKAIDNIQSMLYDAKGTGLIAQGSAFEKRLRGIIGELNNSLKDSLPQSYRVLNAKYADRAKVLNTLNRALGEVVDGVPTRGASLIKQFFSPAGSKTKELFEFLKRNTGVDLAQDATLAKFMGEVFNDPKVRSLLEGLPTSKTGIVNKVIDLASEKTKIGKWAQKQIRSSTLNKAKEMTK